MKSKIIRLHNDLLSSLEKKSYCYFLTLEMKVKFLSKVRKVSNFYVILSIVIYPLYYWMLEVFSWRQKFVIFACCWLECAKYQSNRILVNKSLYFILSLSSVDNCLSVWLCSVLPTLRIFPVFVSSFTSTYIFCVYNNYWEIRIIYISILFICSGKFLG